MEEDELWIKYPAKKEYNRKYKLAKLENQKWIQLSWNPSFVEFSFEVLKNNHELQMKLYENYGLGYDIHVGDLKKINGFK